MKIENFDKLTKLQQTLFVKALTSDACTDVLSTLSEANRSLDIQLTCNGVSLDFCKICEAFGQQYDQHVDERAREIFEEKFSELITELENVKQRIKEKYL